MQTTQIVPYTDVNNFQFFVSDLKKSKNILICGKKRTGKTTLGLLLTEILHEQNKKAYALKFPKKLPDWIEPIDNIEQAENNSVVFADQLEILFPARKFMCKDHVSLSDILYLSGQKNLTFIGTSIQSAMTDINIIRNVDILIVKEPNWIMIESERSFLRWCFKNAKDILKHIPREERNQYAVVFSDDFNGVIKTTKPSFWKEEYSFAWKNW